MIQIHKKAIQYFMVPLNLLIYYIVQIHKKTSQCFRIRTWCLWMWYSIWFRFIVLSCHWIWYYTVWFRFIRKRFSIFFYITVWHQTKWFGFIRKRFSIFLHHWIWYQSIWFRFIRKLFSIPLSLILYDWNDSVFHETMQSAVIWFDSRYDSEF